MLATIGYERASLDDFIATLKLAGMDVVIDIRERAQSRRTGFSKNALKDALQGAGVTYVHLPELGDPKEGREAAREGNFDEFRIIFGKVMVSDAAKAALSYIEQQARHHAVCLLCFERDEKQCHRKIVAEEIETRLKIRARHLGVKLGLADGHQERRMLYPSEGAAASI